MLLQEHAIQLIPGVTEDPGQARRHSKHKQCPYDVQKSHCHADCINRLITLPVTTEPQRISGLLAESWERIACFLAMVHADFLKHAWWVAQRAPQLLLLSSVSPAPGRWSPGRTAGAGPRGGTRSFLCALTHRERWLTSVVWTSRRPLPELHWYT